MSSILQAVHCIVGWQQAVLTKQTNLHLLLSQQLESQMQLLMRWALPGHADQRHLSAPLWFVQLAPLLLQSLAPPWQSDHQASSDPENEAAADASLAGCYVQIQLQPAWLCLLLSCAPKPLTLKGHWLQTEDLLLAHLGCLLACVCVATVFAYHQSCSWQVVTCLTWHLSALPDWTCCSGLDQAHC